MSSVAELVLGGRDAFDYERAGAWISATLWPIVGIAFVYAVAVLSGKAAMKRWSAGWELRWPLILWNGCLAAFSICCSWVLVPELLGVVRREGLAESWCGLNGYFSAESGGYWAFLFVLSKVAELGDTAFLVLRKRPIIFLHWYHHITVLIWMWVSYPSHCASMRWGICMNSVVHALMYSYYTARAVGLRLPKGLAQCITCVQMLQFVIGIAITIHVLLSLSLGEVGSCGDNPLVVMAGQGFLYLTYLALFARFFLKAYGPRRPRKKD